jgi:hypothetical protein
MIVSIVLIETPLSNTVPIPVIQTDNGQIFASMVFFREQEVHTRV